MRETDLIADLLAKPGPSAETVDAGRRRLRREGMTRRPSRGRLFGGLGGLTALVAGGVSAAVIITGGVEQPLIQPASASDTLRKAAERAENTPWPSGKYWYIKSGQSSKPSGSLPNNTAESWTNRAGNSWHRSLSSEDKSLVTLHQKFWICHKQVDFQEIESLPAKPDALLAAIREILRNNDRGPALSDLHERWPVTCLINLLGDQPAPPAVRAAAFRALAGMPGAEDLGTLEDSTGRKGTGLAITSDEIRDELIIDLETSLILETEATVRKETRTRTYYKVGWTDSAPS